MVSVAAHHGRQPEQPQRRLDLERRRGLVAGERRSTGMATPATHPAPRLVGQPLGRRVEVDEQGDRHVVARLELDDADAAHLDLAGDRRRRAGERPALDPADDGCNRR